jgi:hypothetical protein
MSCDLFSPPDHALVLQSFHREEEGRRRMTAAATTKIDKQDQRLLALWAADCAEHVLKFFELKHPQDTRPHLAIEASRAWARGEVSCSEVRATAIATNIAARSTNDVAACAVARAAGHAAATTHMAGHARHAAAYAIKAAMAAGISPATERAWQIRRLPEHLRSKAKFDLPA